MCWVWGGPALAVIPKILTSEGILERRRLTVIMQWIREKQKPHFLLHGMPVTLKNNTCFSTKGCSALACAGGYRPWAWAATVEVELAQVGCTHSWRIAKPPTAHVGWGRGHEGGLVWGEPTIKHEEDDMVVRGLGLA